MMKIVYKTRMLKGLYLPLLLLFCYNGGLLAQNQQVRSLKPTNYQKRIAVINAGKTRSYYALDKTEASLITVRGPGILRVLTRCQFETNEEESLKYEVFYTVDGAELQKEKISSAKPSKEASYKNSELGMPGQLKDFEIELSRGYHSIEFVIPEISKQVALRYMFTPVKEKKQEWISFCAMRPSEPVDLISKESTVNYYRFSNEKPLKVEVIGPTELRVLTRIENHYQMKGRIHYRIQVKEHQETINTYQLSSRTSEVAVYKDDKDLIPGKACEFVIDVPKGKHSYEIVPLDKDKNTILGRFLLPLKDVNLVN